VNGIQGKGKTLTECVRADTVIDHEHYICTYGDDMPEVRDWRWEQSGKKVGPKVSDTEGDNV
jgi:phosphoketolase